MNTLSDNLERLIYALCCLEPDPNDELFGYGERLVPAAELSQVFFLRPFGSLDLLQVPESQGEEVLAAVLPENTPSRRMFEKLSFQIIDTVYWNYKIN